MRVTFGLESTEASSVEEASTEDGCVFNGGGGFPPLNPPASVEPPNHCIDRPVCVESPPPALTCSALRCQPLVISGVPARSAGQ